MTIEQRSDRFVIARGSDHYFALFVDADKVSWTTMYARAQGFSTREAAEECIKRIQVRERTRRKHLKSS